MNKRKIRSKFGACYQQWYYGYYSNIKLAILYAAKINDLYIFKKLLKKHKIKYLKNKNNFYIQKILLKQNKKNLKIINSLLYFAIFDVFLSVNINIIKSIIDYGADVNFTWPSGLTILMKVCIYKMNIGIIKLFISKGCKINCKDEQFMTPLMYSARSAVNIPKYDIIKLFLDNKADFYIKNKKGENALKITEDKLGKNSDIYYLIFTYKNLKNDYLCEFDMNFIYYI